MEPPGAEHGIVALRIGAMLERHVSAARAGIATFAAESGFRLTSAPDTVRAPDVAFVATRAHAGGGHPKGLLAGTA